MKSESPTEICRTHDFNDSLAILSILVGLLAWAITPSNGFRIFLLIVVAFIACYLAYRSHFTRNLSPALRHGIAVAMTLTLGIAGYLHWRQQPTPAEGFSDKAGATPGVPPVEANKVKTDQPERPTDSRKVTSEAVKTSPVSQTANRSTCSNVVAGGDVKVICPPGKEEK